MQDVRWTPTISLGSVIVWFTIVFAILKFNKEIVRPVRAFLKRFIEEHNLVWEDYSIRHDLPYRVPKGGRGEDIKKKA